MTITNSCNIIDTRLTNKLKQGYIMNTWLNTFHNTKALSTLSKSDYEDIEYQHYSGYIKSNNKDYRKIRALDKKLCPHNYHECSCKAAMMEVTE